MLFKTISFKQSENHVMAGGGWWGEQVCFDSPQEKINVTWFVEM